MRPNHPARSASSPHPGRPPRHRHRRQPSWEVCESRILLDGTAPTFLISMAPTALTVGRPSTAPTFATFEVSLAPANIESPITVDYATMNGTAVGSTDPATGDYLPASGTLTFPVGSTGPLPINVEVFPRTDQEPDKTFSVMLSNAMIIPPSEQETVGIANPTATVTIANAHVGGQVQFAMASYSVDASAGVAHIKVTRTGGDASAAGAVFTASGNPAFFTPVTTDVTFGYGQTSATVDVPINTNAVSTQDQTVQLQLEDPFGGATLGTPAAATLTIHEINPLIVTNTSDSGVGSLRYAINYADSAAAPANPLIRFAITKEGTGPFTIAPATPLPSLTRTMSINASTQPGYAGQPTVILSGARLRPGAAGDGLIVSAGRSSILGLAIGGFAGSAIVLQGPGGDVVTGDVLGTDRTGRFAMPNGVAGVYISNSPGNTLVNDVISGNGVVGVELSGPLATGNLITGDLIGTDATGRLAIPNLSDGVFLDAAPGNTISNSVISGNGIVGVQIYGVGASRNVLQGNKIGTDLAGGRAIPNGLDGVFLNGAPGNTIVNDVISGNRSSGLQALGASARGNLIQGNRIGTDATGRFAVANVNDGIFLNNAPGNSVTSNQVSGNGIVGIQVYGAGASNNVLRGNVIGLNAANTPLGNQYGLFLNGIPAAPPNQPTPESQNVIRGNRVAQVFRTAGG